METPSSRIKILDNSNLPAQSVEILNSVDKQLGFVPNVLRLLAASPAVLKSFLGLQAGLSGTLDLNTRNAIALAVSESNSCHYCVSAHAHFAAKGANCSQDEISKNRMGESIDPKRAAAAAFGVSVIKRRGNVSNGDLEKIREAGYSDSEILEIIALSVQFSFTNFMNNVAQTEIDFPKVDPPVGMTEMLVA